MSSMIVNLIVSMEMYCYLFALQQAATCNLAIIIIV